MKTRVCKKHREKPAIIYGKCIGCEIDLLRLEVQSLRSEKRRADVLAATLRELRDVVTSDVETKAEQYAAAIPKCCQMQTMPEHMDMMLCWGLAAALRRGETMNCDGCEMKIAA